MRKLIKVILLVLLLTICMPCMAKVLRSDDGWIHITTSDYWNVSSYGGDDANVRLLSIVLNNDTRIIITRKKNKQDYRTFRESKYDYKSFLAEAVPDLRCSQLRNKGFINAKIDKINLFENGYNFVIHAYKDGKKHILFETEVVYNYYSYTFQVLANEYNEFEAANVFSTMTIDGIPFSRWVHSF